MTKVITYLRQIIALYTCAKFNFCKEFKKITDKKYTLKISLF